MTYSFALLNSESPNIQLEMGQAIQSQGQMLQRPVEYEDGEGNSKSLEKMDYKMLHI